MCLSFIYIIAISLKYNLFWPRTTIHHLFICGQWGGMKNTYYMWGCFVFYMVPCFQCFEEVQLVILIVINCNVFKVGHYDWKQRGNSLKSLKSNIAPNPRNQAWRQTTNAITESHTIWHFVHNNIIAHQWNRKCLPLQSDWVHSGVLIAQSLIFSVVLCNLFPFLCWSLGPCGSVS